MFLKASLCKILFERIVCFETVFPLIYKCIVADISITTITFAFEQKQDFRSRFCIFGAKDKAIAIATDKCSREKHSTQRTSPPWSNEKNCYKQKNKCPHSFSNAVRTLAMAKHSYLDTNAPQSQGGVHLRRVGCIVKTEKRQVIGHSPKPCLFCSFSVRDLCSIEEPKLHFSVSRHSHVFNRNQPEMGIELT